jgi:hypothetical protein
MTKKLPPTGINFMFLFKTKGIFRLFTNDVVPLQDILVYNSINIPTESIYMGIFDAALCSTVKSNSGCLRLRRKSRLLCSAKLSK